MMDEIMKYKYFFACIDELGGAAMERVLSEYKDEITAYNNISFLDVERKILTSKQYEKFNVAKNKINIEKEFDRYYSGYYINGMKFVTMNMPDFPKRLISIPGRPYQLFYYGTLPKDDLPSVAIVGARNCSQYGKEASEYFGRGLAKKGVQIISGMASGVDGYSQLAAIDEIGRSYGVLGCSSEICYPSSNRMLYNKLIDRGGVISEFVPGTKPVNINFPRRNRIISGLSDIVLVVEAKERSGSSITVNMALEQGRDVFAVPGRINEQLSIGCNRIIKDGAGVAMDIDTITEALHTNNILYNFERTDEQNEALGLRRNINLSELTIPQRHICEMLMKNEAGMTAEEIYHRLEEKMNYNNIIVELMDLCINNKISESSGIYRL